MAHEPKLRRSGVKVKRSYVALALDRPAGAHFVDEMAKPKSPKPPLTAEELAWHQRCGLRIAWVREIAELNQEEFGQLIGVKQQAVSSYERGIRPINPYHMLKFCARFRTTLDYVYRGRLMGTHPALVKLLLDAHPELNQSPTRTELGTDMVLAEYRAAIQNDPDPDPS